MKLERWNVNRYQMPYLDIQAIRRLEDALEVESRRGVFRLSCDDQSTMDGDLLPMLNALRDPSSVLWTAVRDPATGSDEHVRPLLRELDNLGLLRDFATAEVGRPQAEIEAVVREWSSDLGRNIATQREDVARIVEHLVSRLAMAPGDSRDLLTDEPNFPILTLLLQARYLRVDAPTVLALLIQGLHAAQRRASLGENATWWTGLGPMPAWAEDDWNSGLVEPDLVRQYLAATNRLLCDAMLPGAPRRLRSNRVAVQPVSGINFILDVEDEVAELLAGLGISPAVAAMEDRALARRVVSASFLQEYFVTYRFVECIAPLLARRFASPLREAVHRYFAEEAGHEKFERENCLRLGMTEKQIEGTDPLPLHLAFIDILTSTARESPISFFCASMFTEGMIGARHSLVSLAQEAMPDDPSLIAAIGDHVAVNDDVDHRGVGRDWMSHVPLVGNRMQEDVRALMAYFTELNWRMWDQLVQSCAAPLDSEVGPRPMGRGPRY